MKALSLAIALALFAAPAFAADAPPKTPAAAADAKPGKAGDKGKDAKPEEKLICTRETDTGSFLSKRVCRTQAQIDSERRGAELLENDRQQLSNRPDVR